PPRSPPFPYTTLFRSSSLPTSSSTTATWTSLWVSTPATTRRASPSAMVDMPPFLCRGWGGTHGRDAGQDREQARSHRRLFGHVHPTGCASDRAPLTRPTGQIKDTKRVWPISESDPMSETLPASSTTAETVTGIITAEPL